MPPKQLPNLVLELADTNIPCDPCKLPCIDRHYVVAQPTDYNKRTKTMKKGAKMLLFTVKAKDFKKMGKAVIEDAKSYQFKS